MNFKTVYISRMTLLCIPWKVWQEHQFAQLLNQPSTAYLQLSS
jgi:hypothetical protein